MKQIELFAGIGGFGLAGEWAGIETVCQVEIDPFCQKVLEKNFPNAQRYSDIHTFDGAQYAGRVDIVSGGFPCQPFSHAGKRKGNDDDRALWPEMFRVIREVGPRWVVGENVAGLISMDGGRVLAGIIADLESVGYTVEIFTLPACATGAPHRRDRLWIIAHAAHIGACRRSSPICRADGGQDNERFSKFSNEDCATTGPQSPKCECSRSPRPGRNGFANENYVASDAFNHTPTRQRQYSRSVVPIAESKGFALGNTKYSAGPNRQGLEKRESRPGNNGEERQAAFGNPWGEHWLPVATRICGVHDGVPRKLDRSKRLKALGNAIVPQVAYQIFQAINEYSK